MKLFDLLKSHLLNKKMYINYTMKILGIDLAGKAENPSGVCILDEKQLMTCTLFSDSEIISMVNKTKPSVILIDAPLSLPRGRCCLEKNCECADGGHFRQAERDIRKYGSVLPLTFRGMKMLPSVVLNWGLPYEEVTMLLKHIQDRSKDLRIQGYKNRSR